MFKKCVTFFRGRLTRERITDAYLITMLGAFPLFPGPEGYVSITGWKFAFFVAATGLWLLALLLRAIRDRSCGPAPTASEWAAAALLGLTLASWLCSPWREGGFLGAGRYDGCLTILAYLLCFLGAARTAVPKRRHAAALAVGTGLCCAIACLQLFGLDPLRLFPAPYTYYDAGRLYSGAYLGTIGNTNILDAVLALSLPLFAALYLTEGQPFWLLPLVPGLFVAVRAGGGGVKLALLAAALLGAPVLLTGLDRVRRAVRLAALTGLVAALALAYAPEYANGTLTVAFAPCSASVLLGLAAALCLLLGAVPTGTLDPQPRTLRRIFLCLSLAAVLGGLALAWSWPGEGGSVWELHELLHGRADDSFGSSRLRIWRECLALVPERPLLGGGPASLGERLHIQFSRFVPETGRTLESFVDNAHSVYLGWLVNGGVLSLLALLALLAFSLRDALRSGERGRLLCVALAGGLVHACFGLGLCLSEPIFWVLLALAAAQRRKETDHV